MVLRSTAARMEERAAVDCGSGWVVAVFDFGVGRWGGRYPGEAFEVGAVADTSRAHGL